MEQNSTAAPATGPFDSADWFEPIEAGLRERVRGFIETMLEEELTAALGRGRYRRGGAAAGGYRYGVRHRHSCWVRSACWRSWCRGGGCGIPRGWDHGMAQGRPAALRPHDPAPGRV